MFVHITASLDIDIPAAVLYNHSKRNRNFVCLLNRKYFSLYKEIIFDEKNKIKKESCNYRPFERYRIIAHRLVGVLCDDV